MTANTGKAMRFCPACEHPLQGELPDRGEYKCRQCNRRYRVLAEKETGAIVLVEPLPRKQATEPLGLPRGSVRALVALSLSGIAWALIWQGREVPEYLFGLLLTVIVYHLGSAARGLPDRMHDPCQRGDRPLGLPPLAIRLILIIGFLAAGWRLADDNWPRFLQVRYLELFMIVASLAAGRVYNVLIHHADATTRGIARHVKAVMVLVASAAIGFVLLANVGVELPAPVMVALCALVSFYFGTR